MEPAKTARERVLDVATDLFYREGVRAVGIDTIIARSGVAKMSLYRNFASKDELVVAYLEERNRRFFAWWDRATGADDDDPRERLWNLIAATIEKVRHPEHRGCPFLNTSTEFPDAGHPAHAVIAAHKREVRARLLDLCRRVGASRPEVLTEQLIVLMDGVYAFPQSFSDPNAASAVREAAATLIKAQTAKAR
ncbi:MAG: TetR/AcrR family transcriptional regulator [Paludisphaera borealis]|uniref:TetR/AcrR family transcriptional regulator n=1 Tax=Paludisphaera borealis TaxID=1387353 RepID=UPI00283BF235|nr:TetR/AcrR family transcriptional regulator [Paludisphaera borealis]MDR3620603.1 TetR/AcrR family transcriptional regulator [Paludisphaera borealis]